MGELGKSGGGDRAVLHGGISCSRNKSRQSVGSRGAVSGSSLLEAEREACVSAEAAWKDLLLAHFAQGQWLFLGSEADGNLQLGDTPQEIKSAFFSIFFFNNQSKYLEHFINLCSTHF